METKLIISEQPKCETCSMLMDEWNPLTDKHEHIECSTERISNILIEMIKSDLNKK